jgi:hypothetical protein
MTKQAKKLKAAGKVAKSKTTTAKGARRKRDTTLNIFLSYAREDQKIADALAATLRAAFGNTFNITLMSEFPIGVKWRELIIESIEKADILIAIASGRLRASHSFTGFEVGAFVASVHSRPKMIAAPRIDRRMIPFAVLDRMPGTVDEFQGIDIDPKKLHAVRFDPSDASEIARLSPDGSDVTTGVILRFLGQIQDIITKVSPGKVSDFGSFNRQVQSLTALALSLCKLLFAEIANREESVQLPKSKLIIRLPPVTLSSREALMQADVETSGPCSDSFGIEIENHQSSWRDFLKLTPHIDVSHSWDAAFSSIVDLSKESNFIENNTILSFDKRKTFRIFVSRVARLYSGAREIHVYVIPLLKPADGGDPSTTLLLKALEVSLGYRFMFLESGSEFSPEIFEAVRLDDLSTRVTRMQTGLNLLLQLADNYGLNDAGHIHMIIGRAGIDGLFELWEREKAALYAASSRVFTKPLTYELQKEFIAQLKSFCGHTREMNRKYSTRVMEELSKRIMH